MHIRTASVVKKASFFCYDKIDQLKMVGRCPKEWKGSAILRLEAQRQRLSRQRAEKAAREERVDRETDSDGHDAL